SETTSLDDPRTSVKEPYLPVVGQFRRPLQPAEIASQLGSLRPIFIRTDWERLIGTEIGRTDRGKHEVLGRNRTASQPSLHGQLASMSHSVGKGPLKQDFGSDALKLRSSFKVVRHVRQCLVKMRNRSGKVGQYRRAVIATDEKRAGVSQKAVHVTNQIMRRPNLGRNPE